MQVRSHLGLATLKFGPTLDQVVLPDPIPTCRSVPNDGWQVLLSGIQDLAAGVQSRAWLRSAISADKLFLPGVRKDIFEAAGRFPWESHRLQDKARGVQSTTPLVERGFPSTTITEKRCPEPVLLFLWEAFKE